MSGKTSKDEKGMLRGLVMQKVILDWNWVHIDSCTRYFVNSKHPDIPVRKTCPSSFPRFRIWGSTRLSFGKYVKHVNFWFDVLDPIGCFGLKCRGRRPWEKKLSLPGSYFGNDSKKECRKKYDANRLAQKFSGKWKKGREIMVEFTNVAEIEFKTC